MVKLGFTQEIGNAILKQSNADLVSFGAPFIANPDLAERFRYHILLPESNPDTIYAGGENGYADYSKAQYSSDLEQPEMNG